MSSPFFKTYFRLPMKRELILLAVIALLASACTNKGNQNAEEKEQQATDSLAILNNQISEDSLNAALFHQRADYYLRDSQINLALRDVGQAMQIESGNPEHLVLLTDIYQQMNKFEDARDVLRRVVDNDSKNLAALVRLSKLELAYKNYKEATKYINRAISLKPGMAKAWFIKGYINEEQQDTAAAIANYQEAITRDPSFKDPFLKVGILMSEQGNPMAVDYFNSALNIDPEDLSTMYLLGLHYQENGQYGKAEETYNNIISLDSAYPHAYYNIGYMALVYEEDYEKAIDFMTRAINHKKNYYQAYYNRGYAHELTGELQDARKDYQRSLEIFPNYEKAVEGMNRLDNLIR